MKLVSVKNFTLEKVVNNKTSQRISAIRELNHKTDPQKKFTSLQYAWFPLQRLEWNSYYRASVTVIMDGKVRRINWGFKTKSVDAPLLTLSAQQREVNVPTNKWFTLYITPERRVNDPFKKIQFKWQGGMKVESKIVDSNTLKVRINTSGCQTVNLLMSSGKAVKLNTCSR